MADYISFLKWARGHSPFEDSDLLSFGCITYMIYLASNLQRLAFSNRASGGDTENTASPRLWL